MGDEFGMLIVAKRGRRLDLTPVSTPRRGCPSHGGDYPRAESRQAPARELPVRDRRRRALQLRVGGRSEETKMAQMEGVPMRRLAIPSFFLLAALALARRRPRRAPRAIRTGIAEIPG